MERVRVLVIDDDAGLAATMVDALRLRGIGAWAMRPLPASPPEALASAASLFRPHAILVDIVMPVDTERLVRALRAAVPGARIIGCTGHAISAATWAANLDGFLHKPFSVRELTESLDDLGAATSGR